MFEISGKYGSAKVYANTVEESAMAQIVELCNSPLAEGSNIRVMPDVHAGSGCVIGLTMTITDKVCPNLVGVDIGCGVESMYFESLDGIDFEKLDRVIRENVPSGFAIHEEDQAFSIDLEDFLTCGRCINLSRAYKSLGTLGGGNHFIEVNKSTKDENGYWLMIHSGSRNIGLQVATYYQNRARELCADKKGVSKALSYLEGKELDDYMFDVGVMQYYADMNRFYIALEITRKMGWNVAIRICTIHNYIDHDNNILRKGSVSAYKGESLVIPLNMRDGSLICVGKGNEDWNFSAPHGAGRIMSRSEAKSNVSMEDYKEAMKGIYTTCVSESTLDESPMAYKDFSEIESIVGDTVDIVERVVPVYNFKAGN